MYYNWRDKTNTEELKIVCNLIKNGELVIFPTETVYGIGANALDQIAVGKIFMAKGKPADTPLILHLADRRKINEYVENITHMEQKLIDAFMPGPFTLILKRKPIIPDIVTGGLDTVGIRIPENVIAKGIITFSRVPIVASSANISGKPSGTNIEDIKRELEGRVSAIVDGGKASIGIESTVVKVIDEVPVILRPGGITLEEIEKVAGRVKIDRNSFYPPDEESLIENPELYKNYAPNTKCRLIYSNNEEAQIFLMKKIIKEYKGDVVVVGFEQHKERIVVSRGRYISIGSKDNLEEIAQNIFSALKKADKIRANVILIEGMERYGIGVAIMDRLLKACEYDYIEIIE